MSASRPLANDVFSGLELLEETVVNAVVVSEIVGKGRPMIVTTAAAMPPVPLACARPPAIPPAAGFWEEVLAPLPITCLLLMRFLAVWNIRQYNIKITRRGR